MMVSIETSDPGVPKRHGRVRQMVGSLRCLRGCIEEQLLFGFSNVLLLGVQRRKMDQHTPLMKVFFEGSKSLAVTLAILVQTSWKLDLQPAAMGDSWDLSPLRKRIFSSVVGDSTSPKDFSPARRRLMSSSKEVRQGKHRHKAVLGIGCCEDF